jgi:hypothetical protein
MRENEIGKKLKEMEIITVVNKNKKKKNEGNGTNHCSKHSDSSFIVLL